MNRITNSESKSCWKNAKSRPGLRARDAAVGELRGAVCGQPGRQEKCENTRTFMQGSLSDLDHKNVESIAYRFDQEELPLQWFIGTSECDRGRLCDERVRQVGEKNAVIAFPTAFPKSCKQSVGVARQRCETDNCQAASKIELCDRFRKRTV